MCKNYTEKFLYKHENSSSSSFLQVTHPITKFVNDQLKTGSGNDMLPFCRISSKVKATPYHNSTYCC